MIMNAVRIQRMVRGVMAGITQGGAVCSKTIGIKMKKADLRVGMIVEDRSSHSQRHTGGWIYLLILAINKHNYTYLRSPDPNRFWVRRFGGVDSELTSEFRTVRDLRLIR